MGVNGIAISLGLKPDNRKHAAENDGPKPTNNDLFLWMEYLGERIADVVPRNGWQVADNPEVGALQVLAEYGIAHDLEPNAVADAYAGAVDALWSRDQGVREERSWLAAALESLDATRQHEADPIELMTQIETRIESQLGDRSGSSRVADNVEVRPLVTLAQYATEHQISPTVVADAYAAAVTALPSTNEGETEERRWLNAALTALNANAAS